MDSSSVLTLEPQLKKREQEKLRIINDDRHKLDYSLLCTVHVIACWCFRRNSRTKKDKETAMEPIIPLWTEPTTLSCDHQMLSPETLSTLPQTNKQAEFHSGFAAIKTPEAIFSKHPQIDEQNLLQHKSYMYTTTNPCLIKSNC